MPRRESYKPAVAADPDTSDAGSTMLETRSLAGVKERERTPAAAAHPLNAAVAAARSCSNMHYTRLLISRIVTRRLRNRSDDAQRLRRPRIAQPETTTPSPTRMAKPSTVFGALAPRSSAIPAPIT